ncbi:MAG: Sensor histidine kinase RcsC [Syntrophus sp. SKADARSKE-3]|nr:Sensor histidine kinase RcsC [Syntrophus sp. SKADARSKE-3]
MTGANKEAMLYRGRYEYALPFYGERRPILIDLFDEPDAEVESLYNYITKKDSKIIAECHIPRLYGGRGAHLWAVAAALYDKDGNRFGAIEVIRDITELKLKEDALIKSERRYSEILEEIEDGYYEVDLKGSVTFFNKVACKITGYEPDEMMGKNYRDLTDKNNADKAFTIFHKVYVSGQPANLYDWELIRKDGSRRLIESSVSIIKNDHGVKVGFQSIARDVTDRKKLQERLSQAQKMEAIGTLAAGIAHDFNNILGAIMGYTELYQDQVRDRPKIYSSMEHVLLAANRAKDLVQQILTFSRQAEHEMKPTKIVPIAKEVAKFIRASLPTTIEIQQSMKTDSDVVMADPTQIHQILMNLCTNAGHAMKDTGGVLQLFLESIFIDKEDLARYPGLSEGQYLDIMVGDNGLGIRPDHLERIFDPYFTTKKKGEGTGLGLAVVHGIVEDHGGLIKVYSEMGRGTIFHVYLPLVKLVPEDKRIITFPELLRGKESILFVDDERPLVDIAVRILESLGYRVTAFINPVEALESIRIHPDAYDLLITDKTMPHMTGFDLVHEVKKIRPDIPVIFCSGFQNHEDLRKQAALGIRHFIAKPIRKSLLLKIVRDVLDEGKMGKEAGHFIP